MAEIAEMLGVTRARVTQIMDLSLLAVHTQERILLAGYACDGRPATERQFRISPRIRSTTTCR